jgi:anti-sigma factor RsiW
MEGETRRLECGEAREQFEDLIEGLLPPAARLALEVHVGGCERCAAELRAQDRIRRAVREGLPRLRAPRHLRARVLSALAGQRAGRWWTAVQFRLRERPWVPAGAVVGLALLIAAPWVWRTVARPPVVPVVTEAINEHLRLLLRNQPQEVTGDPHEVVTWFQGMVDFGLAVPARAAPGFRMLGGGLSYFLGRKVACLMYKKDAHLVSLFALRGDGVEIPRDPSVRVDGVSLAVAKQRGFTALVWRRGDVVYLLVSDIPEADLTRLARSMV